MDSNTNTDQITNKFAYDSLEDVRKKLLNLSTINPLISYKHPTASCLRIVDELPDQIYAELQNGNSFTFIPVPEPKEKELIEHGYLGYNEKGELVELKAYPKADQWAKILGINTDYDLPSAQQTDDDKHNDKNLQTIMYAPSLEARLSKIKNKAQTELEESGSNVLYLVLGFLKFYEAKAASKERYAPLFTIPVHIERTKLDKGIGLYRYRITIKDEGLMTNITLREKLIEQGLDLPLIYDETTPESYFRTIQHTLLEHKPKWEIKRNCTLAILNFSKQAMYEDLDPTKWPDNKKLEDHPIIKSFFESQDDKEFDDNNFKSEHLIDNIDGVHHKFPLIFDADSSQHSALIDAVNGQNLVIEGPPGSGKSQTITNLIAACLANGKRVLFVAEKMAALEVVKSRLDQAGLGDFCLELHSHKTNKRRILDDFELRINKQGSYKKPGELDADIARYEDLKQKLNKYATEINTPWKNTGQTIHQILNKSTRYQNELNFSPEKVTIENINGENLTPIRAKEINDHIKNMVDIFQQVQEQASEGKITNHFWYGINNSEILSHQQDEIIITLEQWSTSLHNLNKSVLQFIEDTQLPRDNLATLDDIYTLALHGTKLPPLNGHEPLSLLPELKGHSSELDTLFEDFHTLEKQYNVLSKTLEQKPIIDTKTPDILNSQLNAFLNLGTQQEYTLNKIQTDYDTTQILAQDIESLESQLELVKNGLPKDIQDITSGSINSFKYLLEFIETATLLPTNLWQYRSNIFDANNLDDFLEQFQPRFNNLTRFQAQLQGQFKLDQLPSAGKLLDIRNTLDQTGLFSIFNKEWREAKKSLISLSIETKPDLKNLTQLLPILLSYKTEHEHLDQLNVDMPCIGNLYKGSSTDIDTITNMRNWYKIVREKYGRGFSVNAKFAETLFTLPQDMALALIDLSQSGFTSTIQKLINQYEKLSIQYSFFTKECLNQSLFGQNSPLNDFLRKLETPLKQIKSLFIQDTIPIKGLNSTWSYLTEYQKLSKKWHSNALVKKLKDNGILLEEYENINKTELLEAYKNLSQLLQVCEQSKAHASIFENKNHHGEYQKIRQAIYDISKLVDADQTAFNSFKNHGNVELTQWIYRTEGIIENIIQRNTDAINNKKWLSNWLDYLRLRKKSQEQGLHRSLEAVEHNEIEVSKLFDIIQMAQAYQLSLEILNETPYLSDFTSLEQSALRTRFQDYDKQIIQLQRQKIAYLAARGEAPTGNATGKVGTYTEKSLLQHEISKKKSHIPVRDLMQRAGRTIKTLKPCFLMSPMSVAQYLKPGEFEFDIVIMDEASQIRPEDALGAIARGKSVVVVGDPKQLPPTSFFDSSSSTEGLDGEAVALQSDESILDSVAPTFQNRRLRWHYRSRHESLIAFSNHYFYDSNLIIFPSPYTAGKEFGVHYHRLSNGRFSQSRNTAEAHEIAKHAMKHILKSPEESLGIIAMNVKQRDEIDNQIEALLKDNPQLKDAYDTRQASSAPLFIKNLENVQGDERDVIIISMTYGPEEVGQKVHQRFGPINSAVGWRRLNVLLTRSKKRMHIFSSMNSQDILVKETSSRGVRTLRQLLEYCETGRILTHHTTGKAPDSDFEIAVAKALAEHGFECEPQLGVAGYYLDLAVKDPHYEGSYLLGVECDGATYHSSKSARDRDRLRQDILESLGWKIRRIWSTDWFKNPEAQLNPILNELRALIDSRSDIQIEAPLEESVFTDDSENIDQSNQDNYSFDEDKTLRETLSDFNGQCITPYSKVNQNEQLLRPAMIEALLNEKPTSREEFATRIPGYLRNGTDKNEAQKYLDKVLDIMSYYC